ncbi:UDP-4-amino-4,6-dideoxy-N-acetyl-beta-L-altrosamine transaminase [Aquicoccus porphyridii]|uniref:UDP-4-amino-4, 6-dideoxy-N-acetyl-beta-L-altrosamine transaminase n=1 Tax=Aquicoccus porphyridii TaxID=1852029 RepID=A0A5A9ZU16_9RHOB|nr:UDP-4-amino-4,6-dideoxy-N-acetyl-beta-L-altrosamine transaminase [Aquicoccus porphyridii]KAA0920225.1 UDP-4-amino-4,6-dideoxy-N-acetyl-beta-L-altrosamine transaminase [Aquicoccus porphyridii]RAI54976.1 UDP-4-amino-4,6-dideoxy-N-acetyl-beta-L-altrosamine transaminase [Rhodobacteraceae bacterium AsT-22]
MIPYGRQDITEADLAAVRDVLTSDFITQGPAIAGFEEALAGYCGVRHGVAMNSATSALHVAYMALGLGQGDLLWTSPNTFVATSNAALYCGAEVDFVDIDPDTYNMCLDSLEAKLEAAEKAGRLPKVVTPVHFAGQSCDMARLGALRDRYGFAVVEDASHAVGGSYGGAPVGNCAHSDITIFSFHPVKIITTAEGGMAMTNDDELAAKMAMLRTHGITRDPARMRGEGDGPWYYQQTMLGYNYRITDMQAALGRSQLTRLDSYIDARHARRAVYDRELADLPLKLPYQAEYQHSGLHLYPVLVTDAAPVDRATAFARLREMGIGVNVLYIPVYLQPWYQDLGFRPGHCPNAEDYYRRMITIPMYATLGADDQQTVIDRLRDVFGG